MTVETLRPTGELSDLGLVTNDHLDHDHDPDSDITTVDPTANNVNTEWGGDFNTPTNNPTVGANLQEFRVGVIKFQTGQGGTPNARIELWENGTLVRAGSNTGVGGTHSVLSFLWDASELATPDGSLVQCKLIGIKAGGSGSNRASVGIGGMEWNASVSAGPSTTQQAVTVTHTTSTAMVTALLFVVSSLVTHSASVVLGKTIKMTKAVSHSMTATLAKFIKVFKSVSHSASVSVAKAVTHLFTSSVNLTHTALTIVAPVVLFLVTVSVNFTHTALITANLAVTYFVTVSVNLAHTILLATRTIIRSTSEKLSRHSRAWRRMFIS